MKQHKLHKEIKAWADGAEIEWRLIDKQTIWAACSNQPSWGNDNLEFRIKPQPKEPQYLYVWLEKDTDAVVFDYEPPGNVKEDEVHKYIGKIKLEDE